MPALFTNPKQFPTSFMQPGSAEKIHDLGGFDFHLIQVNGPTAYNNTGVFATSGIPITPGLFNLRALEWAMPQVANAGYTLVFDPATMNVHVFQSAGAAGPHAEVANNTNLSAVLFFILGAGVR